MRGKRVWQEKQCQSPGSGGQRCSRYGRFSGLDEFRLGVFSSENEASEEVSRLQGWKMDCTALWARTGYVPGLVVRGILRNELVKHLVFLSFSPFGSFFFHSHPSDMKHSAPLLFVTMIVFTLPLVSPS